MKTTLHLVGASMLALVLASCATKQPPSLMSDFHDPVNLARAEPPRTWKADSPRLHFCAEVLEIKDKRNVSIGYRIQLSPYHLHNSGGQYYQTEKLIPFEPGIVFLWVDDVTLVVYRGDFEYMRLENKLKGAPPRGWKVTMSPPGKPAAATATTAGSKPAAPAAKPKKA
jgi:hypothetical protein